MGLFDYFKIFVTPESITVAVILLFGIIYRTFIRPRLLLLEEYEKQLGDKLKSLLPPEELAALIKKSTPLDMLEALLNSINNVNQVITSHNKTRLIATDIEKIVSNSVSNEFKKIIEFSKKEHGEIKYLLGLLYMMEDETNSKVDLTKAIEIIAKLDTLLKLYRNAQHADEN